MLLLYANVNLYSLINLSSFTITAFPIIIQGGLMIGLWYWPWYCFYEFITSKNDCRGVLKEKVLRRNLIS